MLDYGQSQRLTGYEGVVAKYIYGRSIKHSDKPPAIQRLYEVFLDPGDLTQIGEPIPIMENGVHKTIDGMEAYYIDLTQ